MKYLILLGLLASGSCAAGSHNEPDAGAAGPIGRKIGRKIGKKILKKGGGAASGKMGRGTHDGRGRPDGARERKAMENRQNRKSPPGGAARNSSSST